MKNITERCKISLNINYHLRSISNANSSSSVNPQPLFRNQQEYDVIIIGAGHNALTSAAYLSKKGLNTIVFERRQCVGGAAVTEEIEPGFKYSRASYLAGLLRPQIIKELELEKYGMKYLPRDPSSFTPTRINDPLYHGKYLLLGSNEDTNWQSIAQFSKKDADAYIKYEEFLSKIREIMQPILDHPPYEPFKGNFNNQMDRLKGLRDILRVGYEHRNILVDFYELLTAPASQILNRWFESDILKTTLATDAVIGALLSPHQNGSAYVLLHHVMGEAAGKQGVWSYVEGGMGSISEAMAASARATGRCSIHTDSPVKEIVYDVVQNQAVGVKLMDGTIVKGNTIVSGISPHQTFLNLMRKEDLDTGDRLKRYVKHIQYSDYSCGAFKINCALDKLPNFLCFPSPGDGSPGPMHRGTVHFESRMADIHHAYREASVGIPATKPLIEMTIPSSVDTTISPSGQHVVQLFVQYAPYDVDPGVGSWKDPAFKERFADRCFAIVEEFCPGFINSVISRDVLSPLDLENIFGLYKGNIHHGAIGLHQLGYTRPAPGFSDYRTPIKSLYLCGAGTHPGGGVMGAPGRNCANEIARDLKL